MRIDNEFEVQAPIEQVWAYMLEVEKVAPCVPGAELTTVVDDHTWKGKVTMKLGPVSLAFTGTVTIQERDDANHRVALRAEGREQRGKGAASATSTSALTEHEGGTKVTIETDLTITGAVAQYGRGMIGDVSQRLTQQFADCLQANISAAGAATRTAEAGTAPLPQRPGEPTAVPAAESSQIEPASGLGGQAAPVAPVAPSGPLAEPAPLASRPATVAPRMAQAKPLGGIRLGLWAFWRAVVRFFRRLFGARP